MKKTVVCLLLTTSNVFDETEILIILIGLCYYKDINL